MDNIEPDAILDAWDAAAAPDEYGFQNGAGFAMNNWEVIMRAFREMHWRY